MKHYLKTEEAAEYLSVHISFLKKNMSGIFKEGVHYHRASNARVLRWEIDALDRWMKGPNQVSFIEENTLILQKLLQ